MDVTVFGIFFHFGEIGEILLAKFVLLITKTKKKPLSYSFVVR